MNKAAKKILTFFILIATISVAKAKEQKMLSIEKPLPALLTKKLILNSDLLNKVANEITAKDIVEKASKKISGIVSWYADKFHGKKTSSGELYDKEGLTAAHKTLPFGTKVKVTNTRNGKSVIVKVNDRGPHTKSRLMDLSRAAFSSIGSTSSGTLNVEMEIID
ncbi:rare lipoprotein A [Chishuiella changwenlii]|uniref:Probable endolytic peptidoglycan transglycosylase RlpA n=1 Tax=Chishuiella changwenlii TaxID=1434701 RepID=A0A1M7BQI6_9FLAO|nr:septal ring lytic transglycosylase RlpA family protein [Chishuiella changwenlii]GGF03274.1 rplA family protein [Chishuiella changwenlii]SHL57207.1 rare lipoprotein A [Chishuiella changwenlii]